MIGTRNRGRHASRRVWRAMAAVAFAAWSSVPQALEWKEVTAEESWLRLEAPGLRDVTPRLRQARKGWIHFDHGYWKRPGAEYPRAEIHLLHIDDLIRRERTFVVNESIADRTRSVAPGCAVLLASGTARNRFDDVEYQRYRRVDGAECIYVRQGRSTSSENLSVIGSGEPIGDMRLEGWYCTAPATADLDVVFAGFVNGIGVKGFAEPEVPHAGSALRVPRR